MVTLTVTAKGQVTLRQGLLKHLGVTPGGKIAVEVLPDGRALVRAAPAAGGVEDFIGSLKAEAASVLSLEEIDSIASDGWAGRR